MQKVTTCTIPLNVVHLNVVSLEWLPLDALFGPKSAYFNRIVVMAAVVGACILENRFVCFVGVVVSTNWQNAQIFCC